MTAEALHNLFGEANVFENVPMAEKTTFRIGGNARYYVTPENKEALSAGIRFLREEKIPYFVLGRGSNLLVSDRGYDGVVLSMREHFRHITVLKNRLTAEAGVKITDLARTAADHCFTGMEDISGIPGTVGGGIFMNAGAYTQSLGDTLETAEILEENGAVRTLTAEELHLSYRHSILMEKNYILLSAAFALQEGSPEAIQARMNEVNLLRTEKQPLDLPSAGSAFKRPEGFFASKLIDACGLKGYRIGGASVSEKHAGFIVNDCQATAADVYRLIQYIRQRVAETYGVSLTPEIEFIGDFSCPLQ